MSVGNPGHRHASDLAEVAPRSGTRSARGEGKIKFERHSVKHMKTFHFSRRENVYLGGGQSVHKRQIELSQSRVRASPGPAHLWHGSAPSVRRYLGLRFHDGKTAGKAQGTSHVSQIINPFPPEEGHRLPRPQ